ncbi:MAG: C39 family peptidase [Candidatus Thorarchaeota archaeon]
MKSEINPLGIFIIAVLAFTILPSATSFNELAPSRLLVSQSDSSTTGVLLKDVPYVWQEINGFCFWSSITMALQYTGYPITLYDIFALTSMGMSAVYVSTEALQMLIPGPNYRQIYQPQYLETFLGIDYSVVLDNSTEIGAEFALQLDYWNLEYEIVIGETEAQASLCDSIDAGYPLILFVDPYYLPLEDYDILRILNLHSSDTGSGHAILAVGYNSTTEHVWIMDPGAGALGDEVGYPSDGRWNYTISYTDLASARAPLGYTAIQITPGSTEPEQFSPDYATLVYQRLQGFPAAYEIFNVDPSIVSCGGRAYQQLSKDLEPATLANFLSNLDQDDQILMHLYEQGIILEQALTLQHLAFKAALTRLPRFLQNYDLTNLQFLAQSALPHFDPLSTNACLTAFDPSSYSSLIKDTFWGIADVFESTGNIQEALTAHTKNLTLIQQHLNNIGTAWMAAGLELQFQKNASMHQPVIIAFLSSSIIGIIIISGAVKLKSKKTSEQKPESLPSNA